MRALGVIFLALLQISLMVWGVLAIYFSYLPIPLRYGGAGLFAVSSVAVLLLVRPWLKGAVIFWVMFAVVLGGWLSMAPSNHRDWQPDCAVLPYATVNGDEITIHNIRNFDYQTETDYTIQYYDRSFALSGLRSFDLIMCDWGLQHIVHTMVSFGFDDGSYLCVSIETRKEKGEAYSTIKGFFRQYERFYVVADERDLIRLRTNFRQGETVYLYRLQNVSPAVLEQVFLDYVNYINRLVDTPEWYNALTGNCTTEIRGHTRPYPNRVKWDWRILANGYGDQLMYEKNMVDTSLPFTELKQNSIINQTAMAADRDPAFSKKIRQGLPGMNPGGTVRMKKETSDQ
ncbi:DUF4105 domain-containing protein [Desulfobacter postgatei]|uniref:Lnb N-terminal periplasmic domain-containing protein n=1 Tax=Desulfobacter postgatei TaxID=2293 RepID=UPI00259BCBAE|nr:DUF4105 domain-containing protein [uncultured Desulfobacter sp.]